MNHGHELSIHSQDSWSEKQLGEVRYNEIRQGLQALKELCNSRFKLERAEDAILLESMGDVLESLERTFVHHFNSQSGSIVSPKSDEPWD